MNSKSTETPESREGRGWAEYSARNAAINHTREEVESTLWKGENTLYLLEGLADDIGTPTLDGSTGTDVVEEWAREIRWLASALVEAASKIEARD